MKTAPKAPACALCGTPCRPPFQAPPAETAPDLDMRPGEPTRSTLPRWVQTCRGCGACAPDLARLPAAAKMVVDSNAYREVPKGDEQPFMRWAMIAAAVDEPSEAAQATLEAAWTLDDAGREATELRRLVASLLAEPSTMQDALRLVDVLRRAQEFDAAEARANALLARRGLDETDAAILAYQRERIAARDAGRHLLSSALRPPAQRPHVTHGRAVGKAEKASFWQRLTGRS
jgi:hypothetical protein